MLIKVPELVFSNILETMHGVNVRLILQLICYDSLHTLRISAALKQRTFKQIVMTGKRLGSFSVLSVFLKHFLRSDRIN
jgi:hypothetical protein